MSNNDGSKRSIAPSKTRVRSCEEAPTAQHKRMIVVRLMSSVAFFIDLK